MRPRVFPAEDEREQLHLRVRPDTASMRPRVFPAEDPRFSDPAGCRARGFNEAAGIPRGRRVHGVDDETDEVGFNEAAGIPPAEDVAGRARAWRALVGLQ